MLLLTFLQLAIHSMASGATIAVSSFAQVPTTAAGPPVQTPPAYRVQPFGDGAYLVTDGIYQGLFFVACESVIMVDAPPSIGENMVRAVRNITTKPISHVVYSHHHADHIGGAYLYGPPMNITFIAHRITAEQLALSPDYDHRPAPTVTFESSMSLEVGNQTLRLDYHGPNHEPGNIFIYAPSQKILMLVDVVYPGWIPFNALGEVQSVPGYIRAHDQLLTYDFEHFVGGHLNRAGTRQDVIISQEYVHDLYETAVSAIGMSAEANSSLSVASVIEPSVEKLDLNNPWALFDTYIDILADYVTKNLADRWSDRLYGTDVYGRSHAMAMLESVRIDFGILGPFGVTNA
ncbi:Metallo-hydrolase/oxidoreductase [Polychaeton citri CBS 116435]|uniref:Metallo-hydrolase/oxidoreductase n=1 Tax=Polychaeton citri CBS 116435 TaxID=1314669 RepID=A0A9P4Q1V7_9PEZI|nr:Metallo-hydrolase/oxidoreductase [Polychaeton citri CBS 116435]